jgi:hypothetical protein
LLLYDGPASEFLLREYCGDKRAMGQP